MAEIKIEKKKKPVWPWIIALLIIGAIVIWIWADDTDTERDEPAVATQEEVDRERDRDGFRNDETTTGRQDREGGNTASGAVDEYVAFVEENGGSMGRDHEYTQQGLNRLAAALEAMANDMPESPEVDQEMDKLKERADRLTKEKESTKHANIIREAFISSANVLEDFQEENFPNMDRQVEDLKDSAERVKKDELATNQEDAVNQFFSQSADVMKRMANGETQA